jgi:hypothetical protein
VKTSHEWRREKRRICNLIRKTRPMSMTRICFAAPCPGADDAAATLQSA